MLSDFKIVNNESIGVETFLHSKRVCIYVKRIAQMIGYNSKQTNYLILSALNHDIGKCRVPKEILNKKGRLTKEEYEIIKRHTQDGAILLKEYGYSKEFCEIIKYHHENFDGSGYYGLAGEDIPLASRIIHIADVYDALTSNRCYRKAYSKEKALCIMKSEKERYDPKFFQIFIEVVDREIHK